MRLTSLQVTFDLSSDSPEHSALLLESLRRLCTDTATPLDNIPVEPPKEMPPEDSGITDPVDTDVNVVDNARTKVREWLLAHLKPEDIPTEIKGQCKRRIDWLFGLLCKVDARGAHSYSKTMLTAICRNFNMSLEDTAELRRLLNSLWYNKRKLEKEK